MYDQYAKPLEEKHRGEYIAVSPSGKTMLGTKLYYLNRAGRTLVDRICVGALVGKREGGVRILLGHRSATRSFFPNVWDVPGGHCEPGESCEKALVRELQEEIGITPTAWRPR